jgi:chaperonin GroES
MPLLSESQVLPVDDQSDPLANSDIYYQPMENRILVVSLEPEEVTKSGIIIPAQAQERQFQAKVIAVGPGRFEHGSFVPTTLKPGDIVLFGKYSGDSMKIEGKNHLVMRENDVFAVQRSKAAIIAQAESIQQSIQQGDADSFSI